MRLPNADRAVVDIIKLREYCLSRSHMRGRHKARVFESALGLTTKHADLLRNALLDAARNEEAVPSVEDEYGKRYVVDFDMEGPDGTALVRSVWIVAEREDLPRLATCYVL